MQRPFRHGFHALCSSTCDCIACSGRFSTAFGPSKTVVSRGRCDGFRFASTNCDTRTQFEWSLENRETLFENANRRKPRYIRQHLMNFNKCITRHEPGVFDRNCKCIADMYTLRQKTRYIVQCPTTEQSFCKTYRAFQTTTQT